MWIKTIVDDWLLCVCFGNNKSR